jgi:hypothetical protein
MAKRNENMDQYIVIGLEQELDRARARVQTLEAQLAYHRKRAGIVHVPMARRNVTVGVALPGMPAAPVRKERKLSAAGRKAISDAAKKRWAKVRARKKV